MNEPRYIDFTDYDKQIVDYIPAPKPIKTYNNVVGCIYSKNGTHSYKRTELTTSDSDLVKVYYQCQCGKITK